MRGSLHEWDVGACVLRVRGCREVLYTRECIRATLAWGTSSLGVCASVCDVRECLRVEVRAYVLRACVHVRAIACVRAGIVSACAGFYMSADVGACVLRVHGCREVLYTRECVRATVALDTISPPSSPSPPPPLFEGRGREGGQGWEGVARSKDVAMSVRHKIVMLP